MTALEFEELVDQTNDPQFKIGDMVCSKETGFPGVGRIIAAMPALSFCGMRGDFTFKRWDVFENWKQDYVYMVMFEEPRRHITFEEYVRNYPPEELELYKEEAVQKIYERQAQMVRSIVYPEQDLELFQ
jgi:hypothetical protein